MNVLKSVLALATCVAAFALVTPKATAQPSPEEFRQRMMDGLRERLAITNDTEWDAISPKIQKVMDAQRDVLSMRMGGMRGMFGGGRNRPGGGGGGGADNAGGNNGGGRRRGGPGGMFGGEPAASVTALQTAIDNKAPKDEIKAKLAAVRAENKQKEAALQAAREDLRGVLTTRQEASLVVAGILD
jgi:Spy/CpxP family protein refolding chaperone